MLVIFYYLCSNRQSYFDKNQMERIANMTPTNSTVSSTNSSISKSHTYDPWRSRKYATCISHEQ